MIERNVYDALRAHVLMLARAVEIVAAVPADHANSARVRAEARTVAKNALEAVTICDALAAAEPPP